MSSRQKGWRRIAILVCLCIFASLALPQSATAQSDTTTTQGPSSNPTDDSGLTISPAIIDNTVDAGMSFSVPITLGNITKRAVPIEVTKGRLETDQSPDAANQGKYDISPWFDISETNFLLPAQDRKTVDVTVNVPKNAEPGGHYATVFFGALAPNDNAGSGATLLNARVGVVFLLTVRGDVHAGAAVDGSIHTKGLQLDAGATPFDFTLRNTGNVHFQPQGKLVIKDLFGRKVKEIPLPIGIVLPGAEKKYDLSWERGVRPGIYSASIKVDTGIELQAKSKHFVILPLVVVIPVGILLLVVVVGILQRKRRKRRRARRAAALEAIAATEPGEEPVLPGSPPEGGEEESAPSTEEPSNVPPDPLEDSKEEKE